MHIYARPPEAATKSLLDSCGLPFADLEPAHFANFFGCGSESSPAGVVGVELHGRIALLRSLAVSEAVRGQGCGKGLVSKAEAHALAQGVDELYLLTDTAESFFSSLGYAVVDRDTVPESIRNTREYSSLCPASASVMVKRIGI